MRGIVRVRRIGSCPAAYHVRTPAPGQSLHEAANVCHPLRLRKAAVRGCHNRCDTLHALVRRGTQCHCVRPVSQPLVGLAWRRHGGDHVVQKIFFTGAYVLTARFAQCRPACHDGSLAGVAGYATERTEASCLAAGCSPPHCKLLRGPLPGPDPAGPPRQRWSRRQQAAAEHCTAALSAISRRMSFALRSTKKQHHLWIHARFVWFPPFPFVDGRRRRQATDRKSVV